MSLCLGMMYHLGDLPFLQIHFPYLAPAFQRDSERLNVVAASDDTGSEAANYLRSLGANVVKIEFHEHWADALNQLLDAAQTLGYDKMIRTDPDELLFVEDVPKIDALLDQHNLLIFPRRNFWYSRERYDVNAWPDLQYRAWRLDGCSRYVGKRHEGIEYTGDPAGRVVIEDVCWFHYGDASKTGYMRKALKYHNADRLDHGLPPATALPPDAQPGAATEIFTGPQPLDPQEIGIYAPFQE